MMQLEVQTNEKKNKFQTIVFLVGTNQQQKQERKKKTKQINIQSTIKTFKFPPCYDLEFIAHLLETIKNSREQNIAEKNSPYESTLRSIKIRIIYY